jgi:hypothetical protein
MKDFDVLAGQAIQCVPGAGNISFDSGDITIQNVGNAEAILYIYVNDDSGAEKYYGETRCAVGASANNYPVAFDMPNRAYALNVGIGHLTYL